MGAWGETLFEDDVACDIRDMFFNNLFDFKISVEDRVKEVLEFINDGRGPYTWDNAKDRDMALKVIALADILWRVGHLTPDIRGKALQYLDKFKDVKDYIPSARELRAKELQAIKNRLMSEQPSRLI